MADQQEGRSLSLGTRILIGLVLGIAAGLFFGELTASLELVGDSFVGLLQMTVLPYIITTLIANVGRLSMGRGRTLIARAALVWLALILIGSVVIVAMCMAFPDRHTASFFSSQVVTESHEVDMLSMFVPSNIFRSLVNNAIPGVVLFCICVGAALMDLPGKEAVIRGLDAAGNAIARVNGFVVQLTPFGVFAIAAAAAGTMTIEEFGRLRGYLLIFTLTSFILTFWLLPAMIALCTPFEAREIRHASRDALFTAFATGKVLVVLPMLIENTKKLFDQKAITDREGRASIEVLYPLIYPFPYLGKLLALVFIPFAAAFVGRSLELVDYLPLMTVGTVSLFGGPILTIPFLLEAHELPADMFHLFLLSGVLTGRLGDMVGVMNLLAFTLITSCILMGMFRIDVRRLVWVTIVTLALVGGASGGSRLWLESFKDDYSREAVIASMHTMDEGNQVEAVVLSEAGPNPSPLEPGESRLSRIRATGVLRVGFNDDNLPYAFRNGRGELVGLDVEMAHALAHDLEVTLVFVPFARETLAQQLRDDHFDIAMSGLLGTIKRSEEMRLSKPYLDATFSLVVPDHRARELDSYSEITRAQRLKVGVLTPSRFDRALGRHVPAAEIELIPSTRWYFEESHDLDALMISGEAGAAWTMLYPGFTVIIPSQRPVAMPFVYAMPRNDEPLAEFVDFWLGLQMRMGRVEDLSDYWIRGVGVLEAEPRWSVLRNVLGIEL